MKNRLYRYIKIGIALCALSCFLPPFAAAQEAAPPSGDAAVSVSNDIEIEGKNGTNDNASNGESAGQAAVFDEDKPFSDAVQPERNSSSALSTIGLFVRMILVLAFVIALIYGFVWFMKKSIVRSNNADQFLRVVSSVTLSPGKSVQIVSLLDEKAYMLGVSDNSVNLIAEIEDKETISAMNLYADKTAETNKPKSFEDILNIFMPGGPKGGALSGKGAALNSEDAADMLRRTREEFAEGNTSSDAEASK